MRVLAWLLALTIGSVLFALLTYHAQPIALQIVSPPEERRVLLLAYGGSGTTGALVAVLVAGRPWGIPLGGLLCPMLGALVHEAAVVIPRSGFTVEGALAGMFLNLLQYSVPALIGATLVWAAFSSAIYLRRRRTT